MADMVKPHPANPGSCMAASGTSGSPCNISSFWSCGWPTEAWRLGVSLHIFLHYLTGFSLTRLMDAIQMTWFKTPLFFLRKMITQGTHYNSVMPQPLLTHQITFSAPQPISVGIAHVVWPQPAATKRNKLCQNRLVEYFQHSKVVCL